MIHPPAPAYPAGAPQSTQNMAMITAPVKRTGSRTFRVLARTRNIILGAVENQSTAPSHIVLP